MNAGIPWAFGVQSNSNDMHLWQTETKRTELHRTVQLQLQFIPLKH